MMRERGEHSWSNVLEWLRRDGAGEGCVFARSTDSSPVLTGGKTEHVGADAGGG